MGLVLLALLFADVAVTDKYILSWATSIVNDCIQPFRRRHFTPRQQIGAVRVTVFVFARLFSVRPRLQTGDGDLEFHVAHGKPHRWLRHCRAAWHVLAESENAWRLRMHCGLRRRADHRRHRPPNHCPHREPASPLDA